MSSGFDFSVSQELKKRIKLKNEMYSPFASKDFDAIRRNSSISESEYRTPYIVDIDRIIHNLFYNRCVDKTQVFSLYKNDDITRRGSHIQYVSRIARTIGAALGLNLDLIEAIALGHDIGHTPFGHKGEQFLNEKYHQHTGRYFNHNVHSVRVLSTVTTCNLTLQTLDGILCHNGEKSEDEYRPVPIYDFSEFDRKLEKCYTDPQFVRNLNPCTLEGCVVKVSDVIAYLGKDRQDTFKAFGKEFGNIIYKRKNRDIIKEVTDSIISNSLDKGYIKMDKSVHQEILQMMDENYKLIYRNPKTVQSYETIKSMFDMMYERFLYELKNKDYNSYIYKHHIDYAYIKQNYAECGIDFENELQCNDVVVDYIASMTDDYFIEMFSKLFPVFQHKIHYISYFEDN